MAITCSENQFVPFRADAAVIHQMCIDVLGIRPSLRIEKPPLLASNPAPTRAAEANNRFYRGGYAAAESSNVETTSQAAKVNNRVFRGG